MKASKYRVRLNIFSNEVEVDGTGPDGTDGDVLTPDDELNAKWFALSKAIEALDKALLDVASLMATPDRDSVAR